MRDDYADVDYYHCGGKADGLYVNVLDDTRFYECHNGRATDRACPDCAECEGGYMRFNETAQDCQHTH